MKQVFNWVLAVFATTVFLSGMAHAQEFVTDGLIAFWTLDKADIAGDVLKDRIGSNDATINGNPKSVSGQIGEALQFTGSEFVEIPSLGDKELVSVECWAMEEQFAGIQGIVSTFGGAEWKPGTVHFKFENNQIQVHKNDGQKIVMPGPEAGVWYHIVYTSNTQDGTLQLFVNGELVAEGNAGNTPNNLNALRIASEHDGRYLIGMIDEVRIYDRILTPDEVAKNFKATSNRLSVDPNGKAATTWGALKDAR